LACWLEYFQRLVSGPVFQEAACQDELHQVFLFQSMLSALIVNEIDPLRLRILPPAYNYPFNLHSNVPSEHRAGALNDLVSYAYEARWLADHCADWIVR
jgi:hypothetical protein